MEKKRWYRQLGMIAVMLMGISMLASCGKEKTSENPDTSNEETVESLDISKYVTLGEYSGMTIHVDAPIEITDELVDYYLNTTLLEKYKEEHEVTDRAVISGDTVSYECVGRMDGEIFDGGSTPDGGQWTTTIGSGGMIPGFEDGIIGMEIGEVRDVTCTFPDPYTNNPDMSGKDAVFTITLHSITEQVYPELTADLLEEIGSSYLTPEEARADYRAILENNAQAIYNDNVTNAVLSAVFSNCEFLSDPPEFLLEENEQSIKNSILADALNANYPDLATYLLYVYGMTEEQFNEQASLYAIAAAQETLIMEAIADAIGISDISDQELDEEAETFIASSYGYYESIDALYEEASRDGFRSFVISNRVQDWLIENNTVTSN